MKKILIVGGTSRHMKRMISYVAPKIISNMKLDMFCVAENKISFEGVNSVYYINTPIWLLSILSHLPKIGPRIINSIKVRSLKRILDIEKYDIINIHQPVFWQLPFVEYAKQKHCKIIVSPWGSDVLRCPVSRRKEIASILGCADYITSNAKEFTNKLISMYHFEPSKMCDIGFGSEIVSLIPKLKGEQSKREICNDLCIEEAECYIACGYTAQRAQRHLQMVEAIAANKDVLPKKTVLLFQFTYGANTDLNYQKEIKDLCEYHKLRYHFLTSYLSNEDVARLRIIVDLFIHLQPTDANSASLREYLLAGAQCINGRWLNYPDLEVDGIPYHICESLEDLPKIIRMFFNNELPKVFISERVSDYILSTSWTFQSKRWADFFYSLSYEA